MLTPSYVGDGDDGDIYTKWSSFLKSIDLIKGKSNKQCIVYAMEVKNIWNMKVILLPNIKDDLWSVSKIKKKIRQSKKN